jgi:hypothetical protein
MSWEILPRAKTSKCESPHRDTWGQVGQLPASIVILIYPVNLAESRDQAREHLEGKEVDQGVARKSKVEAMAGSESAALEAHWGLAAAVR